jgi:hypothetical protein
MINIQGHKQIKINPDLHCLLPPGMVTGMRPAWVVLKDSHVWEAVLTARLLAIAYARPSKKPLLLLSCCHCKHVLEPWLEYQFGAVRRAS